MNFRTILFSLLVAFSGTLLHGYCFEVSNYTPDKHKLTEAWLYSEAPGFYMVAGGGAPGGKCREVHLFDGWGWNECVPNCCWKGEITLMIDGTKRWFNIGRTCRDVRVILNKDFVYVVAGAHGGEKWLSGTTGTGGPPLGEQSWYFDLNGKETYARDW